MDSFTHVWDSNCAITAVLSTLLSFRENPSEIVHPLIYDLSIYPSFSFLSFLHIPSHVGTLDPKVKLGDIGYRRVTLDRGSVSTNSISLISHPIQILTRCVTFGHVLSTDVHYRSLLLSTVRENIERIEIVRTVALKLSEKTASFASIREIPSCVEDNGGRQGRAELTALYSWIRHLAGLFGAVQLPPLSPSFGH